MTKTLFEHDALLYRGLDEFVAGTGAFVEAGCAAAEPVMVAVPRPRLDAMREALNGTGRQVRFVDMTELGHNPGRIIPEVHAWVQGQGGRRCRFVGEPIWAGRRREETIEATRHEALINLAFADCNAHILCPYDAAELPPDVLADVERTHPTLSYGHERFPSASYTDPVDLWAASDWWLSEPSDPAPCVEITPDLGSIRRLVAARAQEAGLAPARISDVVLAVDEAATNALRHGRQPARLRVWQQGGKLIFEVTDGGRLSQALAGRYRPGPEWTAGRGVWLINQLCDLVELRPGEHGTTIRLHVDL